MPSNSTRYCQGGGAGTEKLPAFFYLGFVRRKTATEHPLGGRSKRIRHSRCGTFLQRHTAGGSSHRPPDRKPIFFPHIASDRFWATGLVAYNPGSAPCTVAISPYSKSGEELEPRNEIIPSKGRYFGTVADIGLPPETAWVKLESKPPLPDSNFSLPETDARSPATRGSAWRRPKGSFLCWSKKAPQGSP